MVGESADPVYQPLNNPGTQTRAEPRDRRALIGCGSAFIAAVLAGTSLFIGFVKTNGAGVAISDLKGVSSGDLYSSALTAVFYTGIIGFALMALNFILLVVSLACSKRALRTAATCFAVLGFIGVAAAWVLMFIIVYRIPFEIKIDIGDGYTFSVLLADIPDFEWGAPVGLMPAACVFCVAWRIFACCAGHSSPPQGAASAHDDDDDKDAAELAGR